MTYKQRREYVADLCNTLKVEALREIHLLPEEWSKKGVRIWLAGKVKSIKIKG